MLEMLPELWIKCGSLLYRIHTELKGGLARACPDLIKEVVGCTV